MISTLAMPAAPETPSQHSAPAPADHCSQHAPLSGHHQHTGSGNVLLSELAAAASAASAASRGIVLPPLRSLVDTSQPSSSDPQASSSASGPSADAGGAASLPAVSPASAQSQHSSQGPDANAYVAAPVIALSQAPPPSESQPPQGPLPTQPAGSAGAQLQPRLQMPKPTSPGLDTPITRGSSATSQQSSVVSTTPMALSPSGPHQVSSAAPAHLAPTPAAPAPQAHHRVLAPAPSPLVPHGQAPSPHAQMHHPHPQPHDPAHPLPPQTHPAVLPSPHNQPAITPGSMPSAHGAAPLRPPNAPHVVYVNPYGYPYDAMTYMYQPAPMAPYGYAHQHPNYGAPIPMMPMPQPQPQPQHPVAHSSLGHPPPGVAHSAPGPAPAGGTPMEMKPGLTHHIMQPWAHTFSQEIKRRTRTGCLTCRRRRVKCDEQHPQCRNCLKSERVCLGYDVIFSFDRAKRADHLMHRRRLYRAARKSHANARKGSSTTKPTNNERTTDVANSQAEAQPQNGSPDNNAANSEHLKSESSPPVDEVDEGERIVLRSWAKVVEMFRNRLAGPLDEMLGSDMFVNIARRTADYLNAADQRFVNVAGELEAMRQLLSVVYPGFSFEGLNILESQIALEKLRTTEDYCLLRGVAECLSAEDSGASIQEMISPSAVVRRTIHQQHLQRIYTRLALLHRVLHPRRGEVYALTRPESIQALNKATQAFLEATADEQQHAQLTDMLWDFLNDIVPGGNNSGNSLNVSVPSEGSTDPQDIPAVVRLAEANDPRGILVLLAFYAKRPSEGSMHDLLNTLGLQGLSMALLEIGMASRT